MKERMCQNVCWRISVVASIFLLTSCKKEIPTIIPPEIDKWELRSVIAGDYKVYDTLGSYLHDMQITRIKYSTNSIADSLYFENFDNEFSFTVAQYKWANHVMGVSLGSHDTVYDTNNKR